MPPSDCLLDEHIATVNLANGARCIDRIRLLRPPVHLNPFILATANDSHLVGKGLIPTPQRRAKEFAHGRTRTDALGADHFISAYFHSHNIAIAEQSEHQPSRIFGGDGNTTTVSLYMARGIIIPRPLHIYIRIAGRSCPALLRTSSDRGQRTHYGFPACFTRVGAMKTSCTRLSDRRLGLRVASRPASERRSPF